MPEPSQLRQRSIYEDDESWEDLRREAFNGGTTTSAIVRVLIHDHLHQPPTARAEVVERSRGLATTD